MGQNAPAILGQTLSRGGTVAALSGMLSFVVYCMTLAPGIGFIDSGELATVATTLGVAHPTGYPLFTLVGWVFAHIPVGAEPILRLNVMAALFCAVGAGIYALLFRRVILLGEKNPSPESAAAASLGGGTGACLLAFSETYWAQALGVEVYSLHLLLVAVILLTFLRAAMPLPGEEHRKASWSVFAFFLGLAFTNHMTTILLAPGLLYLYVATQGLSNQSWRRLGLMALPFLGGLSLYLYLPLRAAQSPLLNWGNVVTPERFWWHFTGKQYRIWIFSSTDATARQFAYFVRTLPAESAYVGLLLALAGIVLLWHGNRKLAIAVLLLFGGCVVYAINYDIHDIDSYFLLAYIAVAMLASVTLAAAYGWGRRQRVTSVLLAGLIGLVSVCIPLGANFNTVDERGNHLVEDYTTNMFASLQPGAVVFSYQWDYWVSASYYHQEVRQLRGDVVVIDKELLRRSWYLQQLEHKHPWLVDGSRQEVDAFRREVDRFERDLPYDPAVIQARYVGMIRAFIKNSISSRPVYVTAEIEPEFTQGFERVPEGLAFRLSTGGEGFPPAMPEFLYRPFARRGRLEDMVRRLYAGAYCARGEYFYVKRKDLLEAQKDLEMAHSFDPSLPGVRRLAGMIGSGR